jgi:hypothetical protein
MRSPAVSFPRPRTSDYVISAKAEPARLRTRFSRCRECMVLRMNGRNPAPNLRPSTTRVDPI